MIDCGGLLGGLSRRRSGRSRRRSLDAADGSVGRREPGGSTEIDRLAKPGILRLGVGVGVAEIDLGLNVQRLGAADIDGDRSAIRRRTDRSAAQFRRRDAAALRAFDGDVEADVDATGNAAQGLHLGCAGGALLDIGEIADGGVADIGRPRHVQSGIAKILVLDVLQDG